jgi:hypothetical protein
MDKIRSIHKYSHEEQVTHFKEINYPGRICGAVNRKLEKFIKLKDKNSINLYIKSNNIPLHVKGGLLFSYLEKYFDNISPDILHLLIDLEPRLVCKDVAVPLLNSSNIPALLALMERGYKIDEHFIEEFRNCIIGSLECCSDEKERLATMEYYAPLIYFLVSKGNSISL